MVCLADSFDPRAPSNVVALGTPAAMPLFVKLAGLSADGPSEPADAAQTREGSQGGWEGELLPGVGKRLARVCLKLKVHESGRHVRALLAVCALHICGGLRRSRSGRESEAGCCVGSMISNRAHDGAT